MNRLARTLALATAVSGAVCIARGALAQSQSPTDIPQVRFTSGQNVVPYFEGWIRNPDGSFDMVFGYFNRNYDQELVVPAGPGNLVEPGGPDRGQPTYFLTRRRARMFRVRVPKDWGKKELVWTITSNGKTEKAYGELLPVQEINEHIMLSGGNSVPFGDEDDPNQPPSLRLAPVTAASVGAGVTLTASVVDDGLPKPKPIAVPRPAAPGPATTFQAQANSNTVARVRGLTVSWFEYRGPAKVTFEKAGAIPVSGGSAVTTARFDAPGTYTLVATASDGALSTRQDLTVIVLER